MSVKVRRKEGEPIGLFLRRTKKIIERSGVTHELRKHECYMKPSEKRRIRKLKKASLLSAQARGTNHKKANGN